MAGQTVKDPPCFRLLVGDEEVTVRFSDRESDDVKGRIREILTSAYEERMQTLLMGVNSADGE